MSGLDETQMRKALEGTDASWDTLPLTRNNKDNRNGAGHDRSQNSGNMLVFPRQVFHGLAVMLVVSLGLLLIELRSPGIAQRTVRSLYGRHQQASVAVNNKNYYSPVPAPFLANKQARFAAVVAPTSEPTVMTGELAFDATAPTSEPTEFKDRMGSFVVTEPTSEPTEFRESKEALSMKLDASHPTHEPTLFDADKIPKVGEPTSEPTIFFKEHHHTSEPTTFQGQSGEPTIFGQTSEPTVFGQTGEPTVYGQSGEPTVYGQTGEPTVYGQSGEPTVYGQSGEPTVYGQSLEPTIFGMHTAEPTVFMHDTLNGDKEPTGEPTVFFQEHHETHHHHHVETDEPTPEPSQPPHLNTWGPTTLYSVAPTSDPTIFPTPEPTAAI